VSTEKRKRRGVFHLSKTKKIYGVEKREAKKRNDGQIEGHWEGKQLWIREIKFWRRGLQTSRGNANRCMLMAYASFLSGEEQKNVIRKDAQKSRNDGKKEGA